jgi:predicted RNase H-like HicB family nuclease
MQRYTVVLTPEQDGSAYNVTIPALPGCFTWGATVEEALAMAREAGCSTSREKMTPRRPTPMSPSSLRCPLTSRRPLLSRQAKPRHGGLAAKVS